MSTWSPSASPNIPTITLTQLPDEVQVHMLSYLRSFDLGPVQQTCRFYNDRNRIHEVVTHFLDHVYGTEFTDGIIEMVGPSKASKRNIGNPNRGRHGKNHNQNRSKKNSNPNHPRNPSRNSDNTIGTESAKPFRYTLGHLRSIELTVVARVLSLPEPKTGYFVSKSWIKKTLLWLEKVNDPTCHPCAQSSTPTKKLTKKQQRQRNRRLSDVSEPWPNANSEILCEHQNLQRSGAKAARSHRKLMDKKSWKVLRKLYPDSTQLDSVSGECLQCLMEAETARKDDLDRLEQQKLERKQPLSNPHVRRFYTRTRGIPYHCLVENDGKTMSEGSLREDDDAFISTEFGDDGGGKLGPMDSSSPNQKISLSSPTESCPLSSGTYVILPRAWCHQWRRYIKTGEGSMPLPPDSSALLCDAHKLALLPPHLEAFLRGETPQLFASVKDGNHDGFASPSPVIASVAAASIAIPRSPVGVQPVLDIETINALIAAGISRTEAANQHKFMMRLKEEREQQQQIVSVADLPSTPRRREPSACNNELLDRENHVVTELVTHKEWLALEETGCWRKQISAYSMCVTVDKDRSFAFSTLPCRECDPTGLRFGSTCASMKNIHGKNSSKNISAKNRWRK